MTADNADSEPAKLSDALDQLERIYDAIEVQGCPATVLQLDDRWGGIRDNCDLMAGHPGPHVVARTACRPVAWLSWVDEVPK